MLRMDDIHGIREMYYQKGMSISTIAEVTKKNWKTVKKYVDKEDFNSSPPVPVSDRIICPKLEPYKKTIDTWLEDEKKNRSRNKKQRYTAKKVHKDLKKLFPDFDCSYRLVAQYVNEKKRELYPGEDIGFLPLEHHAGEAQGDFGTASFVENGRFVEEGKYFVLDFPYSNHALCQLTYGENIECLLESLQGIFTYIGGVPTEIWFDNASAIVKLLSHGKERRIIERFQRFQEHYGFKAVFMNPDSGWEKGAVESKVGYCRRNFLVPVPSFDSINEYNRELLARCDEDSHRPHYKYDDLIIDRFEVDKSKLLPLPRIAFDTATYIPVETDKYGKFKLNEGKHQYSSSPDWPCKSLNLKITSSHVIVMDPNNHEIVTHRRLYGESKQQSMEWLPYLKYVALKPRSFRNTGVRDMLPEIVRSYLDHCDNTERGKALKVLSEMTERSGFDSAVSIIRQAVERKTFDSDSVLSLYRSVFSDIPIMPPITLGSGIPNLAPIPVNIAAYDSFLVQGRCVQ